MNKEVVEFLIKLVQKDLADNKDSQNNIIDQDREYMLWYSMANLSHFYKG